LLWAQVANLRQTGAFFGNFDWNETNNTGNSTGSIIVERGSNAQESKTALEQKQFSQKNPMTPISNPKVFITIK
jgi:hypothetical protein